MVVFIVRVTGSINPYKNIYAAGSKIQAHSGDSARSSHAAQSARKMLRLKVEAILRRRLTCNRY